jgi:CRP/FNR family transcriptional regulator
MAWLSTAGVAAKGERDELPAGIRRTIPANGFLFRPGEARSHVFRVESGAVCLYEGHRADRPSVIEFLFPGDLVGLGFLEQHSMSAKALLETSVTCLPPEAIDDLTRDNPRAQMQLDAAIEREFELRREELREAGQRQPIERVAALLVLSARTNVEEGRRADLIRDSWRSGVIADLLQLSLDDLAAILVELERRGLIETAEEGLRLTDIAGLEALADGKCPAIKLGGARSQPKPRPPRSLPAYTAA